ncbi:MAG: hypothetical protein A3F14_01710 [Gammaproteobacteria bacterium RIFCSPHIGHO2_12_FULL_43_28]|nr:MAG: hypothetical protein A3F14_01710 [Gammaproteobacteria bacterium RIFCSPHIGHO2_12_FULL_43_28]
MKISIYPSTISDAFALAQLERRCFPGDRLSLGQYRYFIRRPSAQVLTMMQSDKVIGGAVLLFRRHSAIARLYSIAIDPAFQGHGLGVELLAEVEAYAKGRRATLVRLEVRQDNQVAIQFYKKHGYLAFGEYEHYYEDGAPALRMQKILIK